MSYNEWSFSRNGLMTIQFNSNVRDIPADIRRRQINEYRATVNRGQVPTPDMGIPYTVFNSAPKFDMNEELSKDELFELLTIPTIRGILQTFRVVFPRNANKQQLVQILNNAILSQPNRLPYVRQVYQEYTANLRRRRQLGNRNPNSSLLISNKHKYSKKNFEGMSFKDILRSVFDIDFHLIFLHDRVLEGKEIPNTRANIVAQAAQKIRAAHAKNPLYNNNQRAEIRDRVYEEESLKTDRILKHNSTLILELLFSPKKPFYIDKKMYTILGYHQENGPTQDPEEGLEMPRNSMYVTYPVIIRLELSDLPPNKVTDSQLQKVSCHLRGEKIRKDWHDIWYRPDGNVQPQKVFERKYHKTLRRNSTTLGGGFITKNKKTRRQRKKIGGNPSPPAAIIEYLEYFPMQSKNQVDAFYEKIDRDWRQGANILQIFSKSAKQINNIQQLLDAVHEAKTTTFCNRKTGDGDCEDTSDRVMELLPEIPGGKYTVESLRFEYSEQEDLDDYDVTPDFVQNHGILIFYSTETKPWFKITEIITYP